MTDARLALKAGVALLAIFASVAFPGARASGEDIKTPGITFAPADWPSALEALRDKAAASPATRDYFSFVPPRPMRTSFSRAPDSRSFARRYPALVQLNAATSQIFSGIARAPIPVLLPFDMAAFFADRQSSNPPLSAARYLSGFSRVLHFNAGPAGYTAIIQLDAGVAPDLPRRVYPKPIEIHITGSALTYDIADPAGGKGIKVKALESLYPDLRRFIREGYVRYAFTRHNIPYVVSLDCLDSAPRTKRLACREASPIAEKFLKALAITGGVPDAPRPPARPEIIVRPQAESSDFAYWQPGLLIEGTGYRGHGGHADWTAYAQIRFPIKDAPAYANSQSFLNWGDCYHKGRIPWPRTKGQSYRCKINDKPLVFDESAGENYAYPWRDNFCETRDLEVWQCAGGYGHQGQDIRPSNCDMRNEGADRCKPGSHAIVAVRDGVISRTPGQEAAFVVINEPGEHIRFRYMHMVPSQMDQDGVAHGRRVFEGEALGTVSNYQDYAGGTTNHLHFDMQVFTRDGWIWANPYVTLIASYERLLGARGRQFAPLPPSQPAATLAPDAPPHDATSNQDTSPPQDASLKSPPATHDSTTPTPATAR